MSMTQSITPIEVEVTADDIKFGARSCMSSCPVARALQRTLNIPHVCVGRADIVIHNARFPIPFEAYKFISAYDAGKNVEPFKFSFVPLGILSVGV